MTVAVSFPEPDLPEPEEATCHYGEAEPFSRLLFGGPNEVAQFEDAAGHGDSDLATPGPRALRALYRNTCHSVDVVPDVVIHDVGGKDSRRLVIQLKHNGPSERAEQLGPVPTTWRDFQAHWEGFQAYRMVPASKATLVADQVQTQQEMGAALRLLRGEAGLTIAQLSAKVAPLKVAGTCRSTVGRVFAGGTLCATSEALVALVKACGVDNTDVEVWVAAWERARASQNPRGRRPASAITPRDSPIADSSVTAIDAIEAADTGPSSADHPQAPGTRTDLVAVDDSADQDDEVIGTVQITRRNLRMAVVLSALAGLAATSSQESAVRHTGTAVLGVAGAIALVDMLRTHTAARSRGMPAVA